MTTRLVFNSEEYPKLSHYLFRYPAKFHAPVARELLERYTTQGSTVLDPFCGSGTLLVEAAVMGRHAIGVDVDPVAAFIARIKTHSYRPAALSADWDLLSERLEKLRRSANEYELRIFDDISEGTLQRNTKADGLWIPNIPNIEHWFRRYVIVDLARILDCIRTARVPNTHKDFFRLCFASILRNVSNADPVPVSGLEVTKHMLKLDAVGRYIDPFRLFEATVGRSLNPCSANPVDSPSYNMW